MLIYITIIVPNLLRSSAILSFCSYMGMTETILEDLGSLIIMYLFNVNAISVPNPLADTDYFLYGLFFLKSHCVLCNNVKTYPKHLLKIVITHFSCKFFHLCIGDVCGVKTSALQIFP